MTTREVLRRVRHLSGRASIHALLVAFLVVCVYPLVWMFSMSVKTDEEVSLDDTIPAIPAFRDHSPYVRDPVEPVRPSDVDARTFERALPALRAIATSAVAAALPADRPGGVDGRAWTASATSLLLNRILTQMPRRVWEQGDEAVADQLRALLTPQAVAKAIGDQLARLELTALTLRTLDGHLVAIARPGDAARGWRVASGNATLAPAGDVLRLDYRFAS